MKCPHFLILISYLCVTVNAATPQMWVNTAGNRIPLRIDQIEAKVNITGSLAETVLTLRFRNETKRMQEGEFVIPLPESSTISQYALEVNGKLRDGVAVEKKQARNAYETIKRSMIDPGLIEREAGNKYRTKVFPIPARGTKLVRIGYIEQLTLHDGKYVYKLPTSYPGIINNFNLNIHHAGKINITAPGLQFSETKPGSTSTSTVNKQLPENVLITSEQNSADSYLFEKDDTHSYFLCNAKLPAGAVEKPHRNPKHINLIWDASQSCGTRSLEPDFAILEAYFKHVNNAKVTLQILRNTLEDAGEYQIENGQWGKIRVMLESISYDGSTNYQTIKKNQKKSDLTLFFTDAHSAKDLIITTDQNTFIFHTSKVSNINKKARFDKIKTIHLSRSLEYQLKQLTHTRFRPRSLTLADVEVHSLARDGRMYLVGRCTDAPENFTIIHENGNGETITQTIPFTNSSRNSGSSLIKRLWAQEQLRMIEQTSGNKNEIITHCRNFGLVSDYTSLIVLERFSDYVDFNIPPPEAELYVKWVKARKNIQPKIASDQELAESLNRVWELKLGWHNVTYTWINPKLLARGQQTHIWLAAVDQVFNKQADLDHEVYEAITNWQKEALNNKQYQYEIKTLSEYNAWRKQEKQLMKRWDEFAKHPAKRAANQKLAISVRGLVINPRTYRTDKAVTLKESINIAGGKASVATLQNVSLYRNAQRITYNLLSDRYQDFALLPGDMVVVDPKPYYWDPFNSEPGELAPQKAPAVTKKEPTLFNGTLGSGSGPFGGRRSRGNKATNQKIIYTYSRELTKHKDSSMEEFERALQNGKNAHSSYYTLKGKNCFENDFYVHAARLLNRNGHKDLAIQVLSNVIEGELPGDARDRAFAYWLAEIGLPTEAKALLQSISSTQSLDLIRFEPKNTLASAYDSFLKNADKGASATQKVLALTERNAYLRDINTNGKNGHSYNFTADIRAVIYSSDPSAKINPRVIEPNGNITHQWSISRQGGKFFTTKGVDEYMLKRAIPGTYILSCSADKPVTVQVAIYRHWGTPKQTCQWTTAHLSKDLTKVVDFTIEFGH